MWQVCSTAFSTVVETKVPQLPRFSIIFEGKSFQTLTMWVHTIFPTVLNVRVCETLTNYLQNWCTCVSFFIIYIEYFLDKWIWNTTAKYVKITISLLKIQCISWKSSFPYVNYSCIPYVNYYWVASLFAAVMSTIASALCQLLCHVIVTCHLLRGNFYCPYVNYSTPVSYLPPGHA